MKQDGHNEIINIVRKMFQVLLTMFIVVMAILVVMVIYNFIEIKIKKKDYANYFGYRIFEVASGSMEPTLKIKDVVLVKVNEKNIKK